MMQFAFPPLVHKSTRGGKQYVHNCTHTSPLVLGAPLRMCMACNTPQLCVRSRVCPPACLFDWGGDNPCLRFWYCPSFMLTPSKQTFTSNWQGIPRCKSRNSLHRKTLGPIVLSCVDQSITHQGRQGSSAFAGGEWTLAQRLPAVDPTA